METIEELLRKRKELLEEIDRLIVADHTRAVTLLFTDIVGSTGFFERMGDIAGRQMVQTHNDLLFPIIESFGGRIIKTIGDSIMASFDDPLRALNCTVDLQKAIQKHNATASSAYALRVRMGLHYGLAVVEEKDLFGDVVNTAARVESLADGEEILVSGAVKEKTEAAGVPLVLLGSEEVKGKKERVEIYLANWRGVPEEQIARSWRARKGGAAPDAPARDAGATERPTAPAAGRPRIRVRGRLDTRGERASLPPLPVRGNPYLNRVMIPHPEMFFGRRALVRRVMSRLSAQKPQSVSLVGERRIGKSSLLNYLRSPAARLDYLEDPDAYLPIYVDFQQTRALDSGQFFQLVFSEVQRKHGGMIEMDLPSDDQGMRMFVEAACDAGFRLVFLFDEFECVTKNERIGPEFYSSLRSLANSLSVCFITASGRDLKDMCVSHEISDSPFFNIFSVHHVGPFQREDAEALIAAPSQARGLALAPLAETIIAMGGLYPFFLQMACSAWFEHLESEEKRAEDYKGKPTPQEVLEIFREETRPHFEFILESASEEEREVFRQCASSGEAGRSLAACAGLEKKGYLRREGEKLVPFSEEFARFIGSARGLL
jgi:class 3 adenylate cyclase